MLVLVWTLIRERRDTDDSETRKPLERTILFISGESADCHRQERTIALIGNIAKRDSTLSSLHLALGPASPLPRSESILEYNLPSSQMSNEIWGGLLSEQVLLLLSAYRPSIVVYDGGYPHRGLIRALKDRPEHVNIWIQPDIGATESHFRGADGVFDTIFDPRDILNLSSPTVPDGLTSIDPLFWSDRKRRTRVEARQDLDVQRGSVVVLFHPPEHPSIRQESVIRSLLSRLRVEKAILCMNTSEASKPWLNHYPLALVRSLTNPYAKESSAAFDMGICDGTESVMLQLIDSEIPFITVPRLGVKDNIPLRHSESVAKAGCAFLITDSGETSPDWILRKMLNPIKRRRMSQSCRDMQLGDGLMELSELLVDRIDG